VNDVILEAGGRYLIVYRRQPDTPPFFAVLDLVSDTGKTLVWEGRPTYGRQQLSKRWIVWMERVPSSTVCVMTGRLDVDELRRIMISSLGTHDGLLAERHYEIENGGL
jgi:hypothetical protein